MGKRDGSIFVVVVVLNSKSDNVLKLVAFNHFKTPFSEGKRDKRKRRRKKVMMPGCAGGGSWERVWQCSLKMS